MSRFIHWLEKACADNTRGRAVLRRSLAFAPGTHIPSMPYVEPFVSNDDGWQRDMHYLVAGLWASHWREGSSGPLLSIASACAAVAGSGESAGTERRFIALLDADEEQLPQRLRQITALLKDFNLDFATLLDDLLYWRSPYRTTQFRWAKAFYRAHNAADQSEYTETETIP
ncbi:MAG: type I-E CRISPR-associated protein Cse2/CasB [Methylococcaceae bacterium]|jgi:CRISPR system Cascade subunit CasB